MKFTALIAATAAVKVSQKTMSDPTPQQVRQAFLDCAGEDRRLTVDEAAGCATEKGHGNLVPQIRARWPQENGAPMVVDLADARRFYERHETSSLA
jgi:hypothetical protein